MDQDGDFVVTWTSYGHDLVGNGYGPGFNGLNGVFARRFTAAFDPTVAYNNGTLFLGDPTQASDVIQVNRTAQGNQQNSRVSMDADGDFTIAWESDQNGNFDVYIRRYAKMSDVQYAADSGSTTANMRLVSQNPFLGPDGEIGGELRINTTTNGNQRFPSVALDDTGDAVIVWSGNGEVAGQEDAQGIFQQRFARPYDDAGPTVSNAELVYKDTSLGSEKLYPDMTVYASVSQLVFSFGEDVSTAGGEFGAHSVTNPDNWQLLRNNSAFSCDVVAVQYGLNPATGRYEAVVTVDGNAFADGDQALGNGDYALTLSDAVQDIFGNRLDGNFDGTPGGAYTINFSIDLSSNPFPPGITGNTVSQTTSAAHSVAADDGGDFVIVTTRADAMLDTNGNPLPDPANGGDMYGSNIYATYYTEAVQRITLPTGVLTDAVSNKYAKFSLIYGGNAVQKLTFSQATDAVAGHGQSSLDGTFSLWFDFHNFGTQDPGEVTEPIDFHEMAFNSGNVDFDPAIVIQNALRQLGGALSDVVVVGTDADNYLIEFGDAAGLQYQPQLMVVDPTWTTGFLPSVQVSTVSEPMNLGVTRLPDGSYVPNIAVSPTNPALTAASIEQAFLATVQTKLAPPLDQDLEMPADAGPTSQTSDITVIVTPVQTAADPNGLRTFDIRFVNDYDRVPVLVTPTGGVVNETGTVLPGAGVEIKKQTTLEFRVNPEVPVNPFELQPDNAYSPSVAMDADGSFVISWTADVSDLASPGSVSDIFARRFEPAGTVAANDPGLWTVDLNNDGVPETAIQGVRPVEADVTYNSLIPVDIQVPGDDYTFRVNTFTTNAQDQSSVAMDMYGNFVVAWAGVGQNTSFFNNIDAQRYAADTTPPRQRDGGHERLYRRERPTLRGDERRRPLDRRLARHRAGGQSNPRPRLRRRGRYAVRLSGDSGAGRHSARAGRHPTNHVYHWRRLLLGSPHGRVRLAQRLRHHLVAISRQRQHASAGRCPPVDRRVHARVRYSGERDPRGRARQQRPVSLQLQPADLESNRLLSRPV